MPKATLNCFLVIILALWFFCLSSCGNRTADIPFPVSDSDYAQPTISPLKFSGEKKFSLTTVKTGVIKAVVKNLDFNKLPSEPYDQSLKKTFTEKPEEKSFDFNALPEKKLDITKIASHKFQFKVGLLPPPAIIRSATLSPKNGTSLSISDINKSQGLVDKYVLSLMKDRNGFIWIGTSNSLLRYDGEYMRRYTFNVRLAIVDMVEDDDGRIWCINRHGFAVIDPKSNIIKYTAAINSPFPGTPRMQKDNEGNLWLSQTNQNGVVIIDPKTDSYKILDTASGLSDASIIGVLQDNKKNIWLTSSKGVNILDLSAGKIKYLKKENGLSNDNLEAICSDKNGDIWLAVHEGGVENVNIEKGTIKSYGEAQGGLKNKNTFGLLFDRQGLLWISTDHGLIMLDKEKEFAKYFPKEDGINEDFVLALILDDKGRIWAGTYKSGLLVIDQHAEIVFPIGKKPMSTFIETTDGKIWCGTANDGIAIIDEEKNTIKYIRKDQGLSDIAMQAFFEDVSGNLFITSGGGLDIYNPHRKTISHIGKNEGFVSDTIYAILKDHKGNFWFTGPSEGIDMIDSSQKEIKNAGIKNGLNDYNIQDVKEDKRGLIWLATGGAGGVDIIDPSNGSVKYIDNLPGLTDTCFRLMMSDSLGRMWIGTDKGIYIVDVEKNNVTTITTKQGLPNNYIVSLNQHNGTVIANTKNKIAVINPPKNEGEKWSIALLAKSEGLVKATVTWASDLITKKGQFLWGDYGVTIIDSLQEQHDSSAPTYVTGISIMSQPQYFVNANVAKDTLSVNDSSLVTNKTYLSSGYADQKRNHLDSLSGPYNLPVGLHLPYDENYLQFQFAQQNLGRQDTTFYCYILEGIDKQWSPITSNTFSENYLNLPAGQYTFKVRSKYINGRWGKLATFSFEISPPWWKTWWAYTLYAFIFFGAVWAFIYYRSQKLIKENRILEEKVEYRTNQLKQSIDELKSTQTQLIQSEKMASLGDLTAGIAHEIQNPLNFVNNFSEINTELIGELKAERQKPEGERNAKLEDDILNNIKDNEEKINHHGKRADAIVKGMLQHSRASTNTKEPTNINALADEYLRLAYHGLRAKEKSFNATLKTDFNDAIGKINIIPQDIGRVLLNLYNNAFYAVGERKKTAGGGFDPTVSVSTKKSGNQVSITVSDNGNGIPQKVLDKIFQPFFTTKPTGQGTGLGLSLSYDIIKSHGGEIKVNTKEGEGTTFIIQLPIV